MAKSRLVLSIDTDLPVATLQDILDDSSSRKQPFARKLMNFVRGLAAGARTGSVKSGVVTSASADAVAASLAGTFTGAPAAAGIATINGVTLTFVASGSPANNEVSLDGSPSISTMAERLVAAINNSTTDTLAGVVSASSGAHASATLAVSGPITFRSLAAGTARNTTTFQTVVNSAAANPTNTVLVVFTGSASAIVCTITPNDGSNNSAIPVNLTSAQLVTLINTGAVATVTLTDASNLRILQTAIGGSTSNIGATTATFSGGTSLAGVTTVNCLVAGVLGNSILMATPTATNFTWAGAALASGAGRLPVSKTFSFGK